MQSRVIGYVVTAVLLLGAGVVKANPEGLELMKKTDCFTCHRVGQKLIGPAYKDVAAKYPGADDAKITELAGKVIKGGTGNWGNVPMRAHPDLKIEDVKKMVQWVLAQSAASPAPTTPAPTTDNAAPAATTPPAAGTATPPATN